MSQNIKGSILVVDDTPANLHLLASLLSEEGYDVRCVLTGSAALMGSQADPPDLILLDIMMPQMDGYQVCHELKSHAVTQLIPVIFLSSSGELFDKVKAFKMGGVDYITKPFQAEEVLARIENHLTIKRLQQQLILKNQELQIANQELLRLSHLDGLTQLANRRRFDDYFHQEWKRMSRERSFLSLLLIDVDFFKRFNDHYGHPAGDQCLQQVADALRQSIFRPSDLAARYGGEEFVVVLPHTDSEGIQQVAQRIQTQLYQQQIPHQHSEVSSFVTLSMGGCCGIPTSEQAPVTWIEIADQQLYQAKKQGRNQIMIKSLC
ncbi:MAG: PleD family two-component system response regulator [Cyanobacteriota bacterium]|nr:PleD family two-component system response regulator [Cyanobacteriota bacterium]